MAPLFRLALCAIALQVAHGQSQMLTFPSPVGKVTVPHDAALVPQQLTVESWFYYDPAAPGGGNHPTICRKNSGVESYLLRVFSPQSPTLAFVVNRIPGGITGIDAFGFPVPPNSWHHAAATFDGVTAKIYMDGVLLIAANVPGSINVTGGPLVIGEGNSQSERWRGHLDELRIWSVARSQAEIQSTMNWRLDGVPGLVAAFHFDGTFNDTTGGRIGTPFDSATLVASTSPVVPVGLEAPGIARVGSTFDYAIYTPFGNVPYVFDISLNGTSPGIALPFPAIGVFPLNPPLLNLEYGPYPELQGFVGTSDVLARGTASVLLPPSPGLIGLSFSGAFITLDGTAPAGIGYVSNVRTATILDFAPTITSVHPALSSVHGGRSVTITGNHFQPGAAVTFAGSPATQITVQNPTTITCVSPPGASGPAALVVVNPDGGSATDSTSFAYLADLVISGVVPEPPVPGAPATVIGDGFEPGLALTLAGVALAPTSVGPTAVTFVAPTTIPCNAPLTVSNPNGQVATTTVNQSVDITALAPPQGPAAGGNPVFLLGVDFLPTDVVSFAGIVVPILSSTANAILVIAPPGPAGIALVTVTGPDGCTDSFNYTYQ